MKALPLFVAVAVACLNILLNVLARKTASVGITFGSSLLSATFCWALVTGTASLLGLILFYRSGVNLSQGIVLMGACSIVVGSLVGVFAFNNKLAITEWLLLATIIGLFVYRWLKFL